MLGNGREDSKGTLSKYLFSNNILLNIFIDYFHDIFAKALFASNIFRPHTVVPMSCVTRRFHGCLTSVRATTPAI